MGRLAYELDLPDNMAIHPVISVAHLLPTTMGEDPFDCKVPPLGLVEDSQPDRSNNLESSEDFEVEVILDHKTVRGAHKYLIKWKGYGNHYNVWKTAHQLRHSLRLVDEYWACQGGQAPVDAAQQ